MANNVKIEYLFCTDALVESMVFNVISINIQQLEISPTFEEHILMLHHAYF